jgi:TolB-like protein
VPGLRVAARTSGFDGDADDVRAIARKLHVSAILEGSVRKIGDRVRVTAQLRNGTDGFHLWSGTYERRLTDGLDLEAEIGPSIVAMIHSKLVRGAPPGERDQK